MRDVSFAVSFGVARARCPAPAPPAGAESFQGTPFRWTGPIAPLWVDGPGPVVLELLGVREIGPDDVLVYRGDARLTRVLGASSATRIVFDGVGDGRAPMLVCPPPAGGSGGDRRLLGLPSPCTLAGSE